MFKKIISYIAVFIGGVVAFIFGSGINRRRVSSGDDSLRNIRDSVTESGKINSEIGSGIKTAQDITGDIRKDNLTSINRLRTAREILERAKETADDNKNT